MEAGAACWLLNTFRKNINTVTASVTLRAPAGNLHIIRFRVFAPLLPFYVPGHQAKIVWHGSCFV